MITRSDRGVDQSHLFRVERARLLEVLRGLDADEWRRATRCPGWSVHGIALHLLGDDLSLVSWQRDDHHGTPAPATDEAGFIAWLDDLQVGWVDAARRISPRLTVELLAGLDEPIAELVAGQDPDTPDAYVSWASDGPVPRWLDHTRELSERWVHRQQILDALDRPADLDAALLAPILDGFKWAYPFRLGALARPADDVVEIEVTGPELALTWTLRSDGAGWEFAGDASTATPVARLSASTDQAWRLLSNNLDPVHGTPSTAGDDALTTVLLRTRAIIGTPT